MLVCFGFYLMQNPHLKAFLYFQTGTYNSWQVVICIFYSPECFSRNRYHVSNVLKSYKTMTQTSPMLDPALQGEMCCVKASCLKARMLHLLFLTGFILSYWCKAGTMSQVALPLIIGFANNCGIHLST